MGVNGAHFGRPAITADKDANAYIVGFIVSNLARPFNQSAAYFTINKGVGTVLLFMIPNTAGGSNLCFVWNIDERVLRGFCSPTTHLCNANLVIHNVIVLI